MGKFILESDVKQNTERKTSSKRVIKHETYILTFCNGNHGNSRLYMYINLIYL